MTATTKQARIEQLEREVEQLRNDATAREEHLYGKLRDLLDQLDITVAAWQGSERAMREKERRASPLTAPMWEASATRLAECRERVEQLVVRHDVRPGPVYRQPDNERLRQLLGGGGE